VKHGFRRQLYGVTNWSNICSRLRSWPHHRYRECYFVFFQTIASSRVIEARSVTIRRILGKQRLFIPRRKLENGMQKYVISTGFCSGARSTFITLDCVHVDFSRNAFRFLSRVSAAATEFFNQAGKYFRLTNARGSGYLAIYDFERSPLIDVRFEYAASLVCLCTNSNVQRDLFVAVTLLAISQKIRDKAIFIYKIYFMSCLLFIY